MAHEHAWLLMIAGLADDELARTAENYIWLAEFGPVAGRSTFEPRRDSAVAECERRGRGDLVQAARRKWSRKDAG